MADKKMESSGKADESRVQNLQTRCEELQSELKKTRTCVFFVMKRMTDGCKEKEENFL